MGPWRDRAVCATHGHPDDWFGDENGPGQVDALGFCATCPVQADCLEAALAADERFGVWGGLTARSRGYASDGRPAR